MRSMSHFNYNGPSMNPLLKPGDGLIVNPDTSFKYLGRGDVICFKLPGKPMHVTHRIVAVAPEGLVTRGDNNTGNDPYFITPEQNPTLLTHIRRGNRTIRIHGGEKGMRVHRKNQIRCLVRLRIVSPLKLSLRRILASLADSCIRLQPDFMSKQVSMHQFRGNGRTTWMLFCGQRRIGHLKVDGTWHIRIPWRFFIDPQKLMSREENGSPAVEATRLNDEEEGSKA